MRKYVVDHPLVGRHQSLIDRAAVTEDEQGIPGRYEGHRRTVLDGITKGCLALHRIGMPVAEVRWAPLVSSTDAMLERRVVDFHATKARTAERMISERLVPSSSARWSTAATRLSSMRTGTTLAAPSPRGRRPRFFSTSTSYPRSASSAHSRIISSVTGTPLMDSTRQV